VAREEIYGRSRAIVNLICEQMIELFVAQERDKAPRGTIAQTNQSPAGKVEVKWLGLTA
jgi:hypothetical protein